MFIGLLLQHRKDVKPEIAVKRQCPFVKTRVVRKKFAWITVLKFAFLALTLLTVQRLQ